MSSLLCVEVCEEKLSFSSASLISGIAILETSLLELLLEGREARRIYFEREFKMATSLVRSL